MHREGLNASLEAPELEAVLWENPMYGILDFGGHWKQGYSASIQARSWKRLILISMA